MKIILNFSLIVVIQLVYSTPVFAQAFGEYGRTLGRTPRGPSGIGSPNTGGVRQGGVGSGNASSLDGRALPSRLVVATESNLYTLQDEESEGITALSLGEFLTPMARSSGGVEWFMVKTQKGLIGWVKAGVVREDNLKK